MRSFSDYAPANPAFALQKLESGLTGMKSAQDAELAAQNTLASARDSSRRRRMGAPRPAVGREGSGRCPIRQ